MPSPRRNATRRTTFASKSTFERTEQRHGQYEDLANERPGRRRGRPRAANGQRRPQLSPRRIQCSTTVITEGRDLPEEMWDMFKLFLTTQSRRDELFKAYACLERGAQEGHLHIQAVIDMYSTSTRKIHFELKNSLKDDEGNLPANLALCVKELQGTGVHTWHEMLGYCQKDMLLPHYVFFMVGNITDQDLEEGHARYLVFGKGDR